MRHRRLPALAVGLALVGACGTSDPQTRAPEVAAAPVTTPAADPDIPEELRVRDPKDARGIGVCEVLTDDQLTELGLLPGSGKLGGTPGGPNCSWRIATHRTDMAGTAIRVESANPLLPGLYRIRDSFAVFEPRSDIAGHQMIRVEGNAGGPCVLAVALADDQIMNTSSSGGFSTEPGDCARAIRMAELILSNLPPKR